MAQLVSKPTPQQGPRIQVQVLKCRFEEGSRVSPET